MNGGWKMKTNRLDSWVLAFSVLALVLSFLASAPAWAGHLEADSTLVTVNNQLLQLAKQYCSSKTNAKQLQKLEELIVKRQGMLLEKAEKDAEHAHVYFFTRETLSVYGICPEALELLEVPFEEQGTAEVLVSFEPSTGTAETMLFLNTANDRLRIYSPNASGVKTGDVVKVSGTRISSKGPWVYAAAGGTGITTISSATVAAVTGPQTQLVLIGDFTDKAAGVTPATANALLFTNSNSVDKMFNQSSFGQVSLTGDSFGPFPINFASTGTCDYYGYANALDAAATAAGVNLANYQRKMYIIPVNSNCNWCGLGQLPGTRTWIRGAGCTTPGICGHEIGHNLGMHHASTGTTTAMIAEYGDNTDPMGGAKPWHNNAPHKIQMGWVPAARVVTDPPSGTYNIPVLETTDGTSTQVIKLRKPDLNSTENYYLSYRAPIGLDASLSTTFQNRTSIHRWTSGATFTYFIKTLGDGETFSDPANGITLTQIGHDAAKSTVNLSVSTPPCTHAVPGVSIGSQTPISVTPRFSATRQVTVTNLNVATYCTSAETFDLTSAAPSGWVSTFSPASLSLSSGQSASVIWTVTPPDGTPDGMSVISATATNRAYPAVYKDASASWNVFTDSLPPAVTLTGAQDRRSSWKFTASASDNVAVMKIEFYLDASNTPFSTLNTSSGTASLNTSGLAAGTHSVTAKASDYSNNTKLSSAVSFNVAAKGGGKK